MTGRCCRQWCGHHGDNASVPFFPLLLSTSIFLTSFFYPSVIITFKAKSSHQQYDTANRGAGAAFSSMYRFRNRRQISPSMDSNRGIGGVEGRGERWGKGTEIHCCKIALLIWSRSFIRFPLHLIVW